MNVKNWTASLTSQLKYYIKKTETTDRSITTIHRHTKLKKQTIILRKFEFVTFYCQNFQVQSGQLFADFCLVQVQALAWRLHHHRVLHVEVGPEDAEADDHAGVGNVE